MELDEETLNVINSDDRFKLSDNKLKFNNMINFYYQNIVKITFDDVFIVETKENSGYKTDSFEDLIIYL
jgi:hypothetical protein